MQVATWVGVLYRVDHDQEGPLMPVTTGRSEVIKKRGHWLLLDSTKLSGPWYTRDGLYRISEVKLMPIVSVGTGRGINQP